MSGLACRLVEPVTKRRERGVMWDGPCTTGNLHATRWDVGPVTEDEQTGGIDEADHTGTACDRCGAPVPWDTEVLSPCGCEDPACERTSSNLKRFGSSRIIWSTEDGRLHPGDMRWELPGGEHYCSGNWSNCDGRHLYVTLPNGHEWDIDSRASNCDQKANSTHRCWVRTGAPPKITAGKGPGETCTAGGGSIASGSYHGFLTDGVLEPGA